MIVAVDGKDMTTMENLVVLVAGKEPGDTLTLTILRDGEQSDVTVTLGERACAAVTTFQAPQKDLGGCANYCWPHNLRGLFLLIVAYYFAGCSSSGWRVEIWMVRGLIGPAFGWVSSSIPFS